MGAAGEGAAVGGFSDRETHAHRALRPLGQQNDSTSEQVHFSPQPQQEQRQWLARWLEIVGETERESKRVKRVMD